MEDQQLREHGSMSLITATEEELVSQKFNDISVGYLQDKTIHEIFEEQVERSGNACALICEDRQVTYGELNARSNQIARVLVSRGLKPDQLVGVFAERGIEMIVGMLAILKAGGAYVPLDPEYPADRLAFMCDDGNVVAICATSDFQVRFDAEGVPVILLDEHLEQDTENLKLLGLTARNLAYVIYTSGSTGRPKGVMVEHRSVIRLVINAYYAQIQSGDCVAHCASPSFDAATWEIWAALLNGARALIVPQRELLNASLLNDLIIRHGVTAMFLTVGLFHHYVDALENAFGKLRYLLVGGDVLVPTIAAQVLGRVSRPKRLINAYGPTETTTFATTFEVTEECSDVASLPIGRPISDTKVYVLDERRALLPVGEIGEIYIGGPGVARGYLNRPELTSERFFDDPFCGVQGEKLYKTGDLGRWREDGNLEFLGRSDFQVKIRGFRVEPGEVEAVLHRYPMVKQALVVAREDEPGEKRLVAYIVPRLQQHTSFPKDDLQSESSESVKIMVSQIRESLLEALPHYMQPAAFVVLNEFPLSANGKLDRAALPAPEDQQWCHVEYAPPRTTVELALAEVWARMLKQERIGIDDNFFALGGDSMMGLELIAEAGERLGVDHLSVIAIFEYPTIREMATYIETTASGIDTADQLEA